MTFQNLIAIVETDRNTELQAWDIGRGRTAVIEHYGDDYAVLHTGTDREYMLNTMRIMGNISKILRDTI
jgi:hypothetical protein